MKKLQSILLLFLALALLPGVTLVAEAEREQAALSEKLIRLHVIANTDADADQALKLRVRDAVLAEVDALVTPGMSRDEAAALLLEHEDGIRDAAEAAAAGERVAVTLTTEYYPTREYDTFSLPAGEYLSLRVLLGEAQGHNWWCVVFPPLCTELCTGEAGELEAAWALTEEETALITGEDGTVIRFRLIEWWEQFMQAVNG